MNNRAKKESTAFSNIETTENLIKYLESADRRSNINFLHHYTSLEVAIKIIHDKKWHLSSAKNMNDILEFSSGDPDKWENKLFSSLMAEDKESIAMWSMYGQPWERGVKISIPKEVVNKWLREVKTLYEISTDNYMPTGRSIDVNKGDLKAIAVAYSNCHDTEDEGKEVLQWSNVYNEKCHINASNFGELTGYIKNKAWAYEKEHRFMLDQKNEYERGSIDVPDSVINSLILTPSPLFEGNFSDELSKTIEQELNIQQSLFFRKLNINTICNQCELKQKQIHAS